MQLIIYVPSARPLASYLEMKIQLADKIYSPQKSESTIPIGSCGFLKRLKTFPAR